MDEIDGYDRSRALEMQRRGASLDEIALTLDLNIVQLESVVREANRSKIPKSIEDREAEAGRHYEMLNHVTTELLKAWEKSKHPFEEIRETTFEGENDSGARIVIRTKIEKITRPQIGNPAFIREVRETLADVRRLFALDAPKVMDVTVSESSGARPISIIKVIKPVDADD